MQPQTPEPTEAATAALELSGLEKSYGDVHALRGLSLRVERGEVYGFLGRNGAGKSTAIRIIMGITRASRGRVRVLGRRLTAGAVRVRQRVGYVAQEQAFYGWMTPLTIGEFVAGFYPTWDGAEYRRLVAALELPPERKIRTFSGGMRAKLALALALAHRPELLVLDEPTAGLDAVARREFIEMVREQANRQGHTTFFSSHLIDEVEAAADRVGILEQGRALYEGSLATLAARVRLLVGEPGAEPPAWAGEARVVQDRARHGRHEIVLEAGEPQLYARPLPAEWALETMSLEDIFVSLVSKPLASFSDALDPQPNS